MLFLFLGFVSFWGPDMLAQKTDDDVDTEIEEYQNEEEKPFDPLQYEEERYDETHDEPTPWEPNSQDSYFQEDLEKHPGAEDTWQKNSAHLKYNQETKPEEKKKNKDKLNKFTGEGFGEVFRWILIVLGIILIFGLIIFLVQGGSFRQGSKIKVDISDEKLDWIEENLPEADVLSPLEAAIAAGEYRKAIRLYFLLIVQKLTLSEEINWQKEKTNRTYILETYQKDYHENFRSCVRIYERVWYGERGVNRDEFEKIEPVFKELANRFIVPQNEEYEG
ncbi:MAG TPA: hypothetical protein ENK85_03450 [Saprospiraceae bacterium]|nr:hypothetical protein [Saprospiraceae bacterium]